MAKHNPHYHAWIFNRRAPTTLDTAVPETDLEDRDDNEPTPLTEFQRTMEQRRRIEILDEARLLKANLNDLW